MRRIIFFTQKSWPISYFEKACYCYMGEIDVIRKATWQLHSIWIITKAMSSFHQCGFNFWWFFWHFSRLSVICSYYFSDIHISRFTASSNLGAAGSGSKKLCVYIYVGNRKLGNGFQRSKGTGRHWCLTWFCDKHNNIKQCQQFCRCDFFPPGQMLLLQSLLDNDCPCYPSPIGLS